MTCTEDALIEQPAINLFAELGWQAVTTAIALMPLHSANSLGSRLLYLQLIYKRSLRKACTTV